MLDDDDGGHGVFSSLTVVPGSAGRALGCFCNSAASGVATRPALLDNGHVTAALRETG
ncbi:hypothetical protein [Dietzia alimentaria]|uniref:hypothetical protein n=1 Tax=Dietzia alimentaria TaxID=665550 RepID=UPI000301EA81|nr:hypothetical protein [Dietzia alimentaria]